MTTETVKRNIKIKFAQKVEQKLTNENLNLMGKYITSL